MATTPKTKTPPPPARCDGCRWRAQDLRCHRMPPQPHFPHANAVVYPRVLDDDWCGEFSPKAK